MSYTVSIHNHNLLNVDQTFLTKNNADTYFEGMCSYYNIYRPAWDTKITFTDNESGIDLKCKKIEGTKNRNPISKDVFLFIVGMDEEQFENIMLLTGDIVPEDGDYADLLKDWYEDLRQDHNRYEQLYHNLKSKVEDLLK